ncbi:hypothetical protein CK215_14510 [Mesorhizobium sp. WSM3864]|uniref:hypothetical protein n=1 Tax=Mesorhizobium sp. WSM3864 TaxID=2029404 RepID=UPI000BAF5802|nr:hypothetical protein [Mesorhizobium sp. WSM3864]PBB92134.1 hypothetical protein CK215_14510 [Mesorhizobium sp. WSM3864]
MAKRREQDPNYQFTMAANPHSWLLAADSLHDQAMQLASKERKGLIVQTDGHDRVLGRWEESNKAVFLLGGFALENAIKAFLVYEHPQWISNGRLSRNLRSHSLTGLHAQSTLVPYKTRHRAALAAFEQGLESWARYPCALSVEVSVPEPAMTSAIWSGYVFLMRAYGRRLQRLLSDRFWEGPHGFKGRWTFRGEFLGAGARQSNLG